MHRSHVEHDPLDQTHNAFAMAEPDEPTAPDPGTAVALRGSSAVAPGTAVARRDVFEQRTAKLLADTDLRGLLGVDAQPRRVTRRARAPRREPGPDTRPGLANYFNDRCPPVTWAGGLERGSPRALLATIGDLRDLGLTPDQIRSMIDLYFAGIESPPATAYAWDFKWRRYQLLKKMRESGALTAAEDYAGWDAVPAVTDYRSSWGSREIT